MTQNILPRVSQEQTCQSPDINPKEPVVHVLKTELKAAAAKAQQNISSAFGLIHFVHGRQASDSNWLQNILIQKNKK